MDRYHWESNYWHKGKSWDIWTNIYEKDKEMKATNETLIEMQRRLSYSNLR